MQRISALSASTKSLATGYFASVMATGIISIALFLLGYHSASEGFLGMAMLLYVILIFAYFLRLVLFPKEVWQDLTNAGKVFGYFTFVAGTDVLGTRLALVQDFNVAVGLGLIALCSWLVLTYFILMFLLFYNDEPAHKVLNGSWLVTTVSCESLSVLASVVLNHFPRQHTAVLFASYAFFSLGVILYLVFIALIMNRFFFSTMSTKDLSPPYWINMGAMAITTLAGSRLVLAASNATFLSSIRPFVEGFTLLLWAWGTWWIPFLVLIGVWKYLVKKEPFLYEPNLWSIVFPLGMYTVACDMLSQIPGLSFIHAFVPSELWIALGSWIVVASAFFVKLLKRTQHKSGPRMMRRAG